MALRFKEHEGGCFVRKGRGRWHRVSEIRGVWVVTECGEEFNGSAEKLTFGGAREAEYNLCRRCEGSEEAEAPEESPEAEAENNT